MNPAVVPELEALWSGHVASVRGSQAPTPTTGSVGEGQGRRLDAILRKQIEDLAQERLTAVYDLDGWDVEDLR